MTGDESERLSAAFHARAAAVGGASEERQGVGFGFKFNVDPAQALK